MNGEDCGSGGQDGIIGSGAKTCRSGKSSGDEGITGSEAKACSSGKSGGDEGITGSRECWTTSILATGCGDEAIMTGDVLRAGGSDVAIPDQDGYIGAASGSAVGPVLGASV